MSDKLKQKKNVKSQLRIVSIVKELYTPYKFFLYGDIPFDFDFHSKKGMIFCENNSLAGFKSCKRVTKSKSYLHFDLCNDENQLNDFQFIINKIKTMEGESIRELSMNLQNYQNRINAEKVLDEQFQIIQQFDSLLNDDFDIQKNIFDKANQILEAKIVENPFIHYQIYRKTPYEFSTLRSGLSVPGLQYFGIDIDLFEQTMLRDNYIPINRDEKAILLALRSLQKLNIDHAKYAKSGEAIDSIVQIKYNNVYFSVTESSSVYALSDFVNTVSDCNYYLVLHILGISNQERISLSKSMNQISYQNCNIPMRNEEKLLLKKRNISISQNSFDEIGQLSSNQESSQQYNSNQNNNVLKNSNSNQQINSTSSLFAFPSALIHSQHNQSTSITNYQNQKVLSPTSFSSNCDISLNQPSEYQNNQINNNEVRMPIQNEKTNYQNQAQEFISNFYNSKEDEKKKQQQFDKVLQTMLKKKQQKLKVKLI